MTKQIGEELPEEVRLALIDTYEGWEIVGFLGIKSEEIISRFEEELIDELEELLDLLDLRKEDDNDEQYN